MTEPQTSPPNSMVLDGIFASQAIDSSGEELDIKGADISSLNGGRAVVNWEHNSNGAQDVVGRVLWAKKIFSEKDCANERELGFWKKIELPLIYGVVRLFDGAGHPSAVGLAAQIRDAVANKEKLTVGWSIEGSTLESKDKKLLRTVCRAVAATVKECNKTCSMGLITDPNAPRGFDKKPEDDSLKLNELEHPNYARLGGSEFQYNPVLGGQELEKALEAGGYNMAPAVMTVGTALQVEDRSLHLAHLRNQARAALRDWDKQIPFRQVLKMKLPEASDDFIDRFAGLVDNYRLNLQKKEEGPAKRGTRGHQGPSFKQWVESGKAETEQATIRGKPVKPNPDIRSPSFDEKKGILHTQKGSFPMYIPSRDKEDPEAGTKFHNILNDKKINEFHDYATENWAKVHKLLKEGKLPEEVIMHGVLFSQLSPNTPVASQELMYCLDSDTILVSNGGVAKSIANFVPGDRVWAVNQDGESIVTEVVHLHDHGEIEGYEIFFSDGFTVTVSQNHKFLTSYGMKPLWEIVLKRMEILCEISKIETMAIAMRPRIQDGSLIQVPPQKLSKMQRLERDSQSLNRQKECEVFAYAGGKKESLFKSQPEHGRNPKLGKGKSGQGYCSTSQGRACNEVMAREESSSRSPSLSKNNCISRSLEAPESGQIQGKLFAVGRIRETLADNESRKISENHGCIYSGWHSGSFIPIQGRKMVEGVFGLEPGSDSLSGNNQGRGLSGPIRKNLDRSRRILAFFPRFERRPGEITLPSAQGFDSQERSAETWRRDVIAFFGGLFFPEEDETSKRKLAPMAYGDAPLSETRSLVLRRIVRVRAVGPRRMYDLEVAHAKHNFLLPNGVITSNSHLVDSMRHTGLDPRTSEFSNIRQDWLGRDNPSVFPEHGRSYFERLQEELRLKHDSKLTNRKAGDISSFMLANNKFKNMERYHTLHKGLVELVGRHRHDARSAVQELMEHKHKAMLWDAKRRRDIDRGNPDPGEYQGPNVPGLAPKTARYTYGMMGGGNVIVPDTHMSRYLFGLEKGKDNPTISYIKDLLWNPNNSEVLNGIDRYYAQHHDAVRHMREHPRWKHEFESDEDAIFPAFWKNWVAIAPHERARGLKTLAHNEATDHRPFWEAIAPHLTKAEADNETSDTALPEQTAVTMHEWVKEYGETPAMMLYYRYLVPRLLAAAERRKKKNPVMKMEALAIELRKALGDLKTPPVSRQKSADTRQEQLNTGVVDSQRHSVGEYNQRPEQHALVHGLDFGGKSKEPDNPWTARAQTSHWRKAPNGSWAFVKMEPKGRPVKIGFGESRREGLFHNLAHNFFGLGQYVTPTAVIHHPTTGEEHAIIEGVRGGEHYNDSPWQRDILKKLGDSGELDKLMIQDLVMGIPDRHDHNYMLTPKGLKLIDHGFALEIPGDMPHYVNANFKGGAVSVHPDARQWLRTLDSDKLRQEMLRHQVPQKLVDNAVMRLERAQGIETDFAKKKATLLRGHLWA